MPELWDQLVQQPVAEPPSLWPGGDRAPLRITVGGPTMKDGAQASPGSSLDPFNPPQVQYVGTPLANTLWSVLKEMGVKGQRLLSGLQQYSGEQFPASTGTQTMSTDTEPVKQAVENMDPMLANLWGVGSASVPRGAVGAIGSSPFYSAAQRAVENAKLGKGTPEQWLGYLRNQPGVKGEEVDRMFGNLPQEGILTKEQMQAHAAENAMTLGETSFGQNAKTMDAIAKDLGYGGWHSSLTEAQKAEVNAAYDAQGMQAGTRYSQWQLPGGENYREKLLTLPSEMPETAKATINNYNVLNRRMADQMAEWKGLAEARPPGDPETLAAYQRLAATRREAHAAEDAATKIKQQYRDSTFRSSHWDEPNVLAHMRMNDREVPGVGKSLHLEEIQSDWHQKGRNEGYSLPSEQTALMDSEYRALVHKNADARARGYEPNDADVNRARELETALIRSDQSKIPDAPFKSTWPDVALKRSIRDAAEGGYDALSWTPGEAQAARYSLSNQLKELQYMKHENGTYEIAGTTKNGEGFNHPEMVTAEKLPDVVGKEMAQKIINNEGKRTRGQNYNGGYFDGIDLKVGGEGMKAFYDKMLVDKANALGKKHGARVEQQTIDKPYVDQFGKTKQEQAQPVHVLRITPQLREAAMKGFPLFSALFGATAAAPSLWPQQGRQ